MSLPDGIQWEKHTSGRGKEYEIGTLASTNKAATEDPATVAVPGSVISENADSLAESDLASIDRKTDFGIQVNWPVKDNVWIDASDEVRNKAAITRYKVHWSSSPTYDYIIEFTNTEHYDYYFYDQTGDSYRCNTFANDDHFVRYNSKQPAINFISGD